jgi:hypothetical protein
MNNLANFCIITAIGLLLVALSHSKTGKEVSADIWLKAGFGFLFIGILLTVASLLPDLFKSVIH